MTQAQCHLAQIQIKNLAIQATHIDVDSLLAEIDQAETLGPVLNPAHYRQVAPHLPQLKTLAQAVKALKQAASKELSV